jgi:autotransporter-associated beta strand protein
MSMPSIPAFRSAAAQPPAATRRRPSALKRYLKRTVFAIGGGTASVLACQQGFADTLDGNTYTVTSTSISSGFTLDNVSGNIIDINGKTATISGAFTGSGGVTFIDSVGGGKLTLTSNDSTYTGSTTIASGATLLLSGTGAISDSGNPASSSSSTSTTPVVTTPLSSVIVNGTFDISNTTNGATIVSLAGSNSSATVNLGAESLTLSQANDTFAGTITGTGELSLTAGTETLTGASTYTGLTTITSGSLILTGNGSLADSSGVTDGGVLDISGTTAGASLVSLAGGGKVNLGAQTLTLTNAAGVFTGVITGSGGLVISGGNEDISGNNTFTGGVTVASSATLDLGSETVAYNVANSGTVTFDTGGTVAMSGVISGSGIVTEEGAGVASITSVQTYTGATTITTGTMTLSGNGSIASSSGVTVDGALDVLGASGATITTLSGSGSVELGGGPLTISQGAGTTAIFTGTIYGSGALILAGGSETLTGTNTYSGTTTVASGATLVLPAGSSLQSSSIIDYGTLDISTVYSTNATYATVGSLAGNGTVTLGEHTLILNDAGDTFSGTISGTGGLTISAGTETLSGKNTYTGITTISSGASLVLSSTGSLSASGNVVDSGTLDISATAGTTSTFTSLSGSGTINLGSHTLQLTNASGTFSGTIQSSGGLTISGGTEVLSGNNSYTGTTTIGSGAKLQLGDSTSTGAIVGNVVDNGTLAFDRTDSSVFAGAISGSGALLVQDGGGTTILTADNSYTGVTTIQAGTLQLGDVVDNGGTSGSITGTSNVVDNGTLAFGRSDSKTFAAVISGNGGVTQVSGTTILTAADTYTGTTAIDSGATLALGGAGSISASAGVTDNGTFDVSAATAPQIASLAGSGNVALGSQTLTLSNAAGTFSGTISGGGNLIISAGTETLSGAGSYTGTTTINGGTLLVNGAISSGVTVNSGGTLGGTGTVPSVTLNSGGMLAPGAAGAGTLTVNGAVTFVSGSKFVVEQSSVSYAALKTTGAETLGGTLSVASTDGTYMLGTPMTVLTANGGLSGSFGAPGTITGSNGAQFTTTVKNVGDTVTLEIDLSKLTPALPTNATANQKNVVGGIDAAIAASTKPLPPAFENLGNLSSATLASDATQLAGEIGGDVPQMGTTLFTPFLNAMFDHVSDEYLGVASRRDAPPSYWLSGFSGSGNVNGAPTLGTQKLSSHLTGVVAGANWSLSPDFQLGGAISAGFVKFRLADDGGTGKTDAIQAGLYGFVQYSRHFYGSFALAFARDDITTDRLLTVSGSDTLTAKPTTTVYGGRYETGVLLGWTTPYLAVQDVLSDVPAYSETAASGSSDTFALSYAGRSDNEASAELGIRQAFDIAITPRWVLTPDGVLHLTDRLAWSHDLTGAAHTTAAFAALASSGFTVDHAEANKDAGLASIGAELKFDGGFSIAAHFNTALSSNSQSYTGYAGVKYTW